MDHNLLFCKTHRFFTEKNYIQLLLLVLSCDLMASTLEKFGFLKHKRDEGDNSVRSCISAKETT